MASNPSQGKLTKTPQLEEVQPSEYQSLDKSSSNTLKVFSLLVVAGFVLVVYVYRCSCYGNFCHV